MTFEEQLINYAELLVVHGLNVQKGQVVNISAEVCHKDFVVMLVDTCYRHGATSVHVDLSDPRTECLRLIHSTEDDLTYVPSFLDIKYRELVDSTAANLKLIGPENPELFSKLDAKRVNTLRHSQRKALKYFYEEGIGKSKVHWTVAAAATPLWGQRVFPGLGADQACGKLWEAILKICRADTPECLALWKQHNTVLQSRAKKLTELKIEFIHFKGPETDLTVRLSRKALFKGGGDLSPRQVEYEPNIPTEEVFTTPDWRGTKGRCKTTRPFLINGKLVKGLSLEFVDGRISSFSAEEGQDTFAEYIKSDEGACRLGEVALVGIDSPVFQSGLIFEEILFDENAACHIAIGLAYKFCVDGGAVMSGEELESIGCNVSAVHTDMMISNEKVDVVATTYSGETIQLLKNGAWVWS